MKNERKIKNRIKLVILMPLFLGVVLLGLCIYKNGFETRMGLLSIGILVIYLLITFIMYFRTTPYIESVLVEYSLEQGKIQKELLHELEVPYAILDLSGHIMWANNMFHDTIGVAHNKRIRKSVDAYFPEIVPELIDGSDSIEISIEHDNRMYKVSIKRIDMSKVFDEDREETKDDDIVLAMYLFDETELRRLEQESVDQKLYAGLLYLDNYDEVMDDLEDIKHSILTALVERKINMYLSNIDAIVKHIENDKYFFVFKQKYMQTLRDDKFSILDDVKNINVGNQIAMTLSIGIGFDSESQDNGYMTAYENARVAIGMAMGRGGDQAAVKTGEQVTYYGGKSAGVEKTTRVKARVKAQAFEELLMSKEKVLIMAHKRPDADAFGSAIGIYRLVSNMNKKAYVVVNEVTDAIRPLMNSFKVGNAYDGVFLTSTEAVAQVDQNTVVVVCDVNKPSMTECEELLELVPTVVVFDHHRQTAEAIKGATLSYIEPFASSACEMIAEMMQYIGGGIKVKGPEADAMYGGIVIDTQEFTNQTGVRTFEAAAYLRRCGADITRIRKVFRENFTDYQAKAAAISNAEIYRNSYAFSTIDSKGLESPTVVCAQTANELLNIRGIKASIVLTLYNDIIYVSARSIDEMNVQVLMEKLGGGGHRTIAGVQFKEGTVSEAISSIKDAIDQMIKEGEVS